MRKSHVGIASVLRLYCIGAIFALPALAGEFSPAQNPRPECPADFFVKSAVVFDAVTICGTKSVPDDKLSHAAQVAAQWLDNDQNGRADEARLLATLRDNRPVLVMSARGFRSRAIDKIMDRLDQRIGQDLAADETAPARRDERDASQEEIHHLIVNAGWMPLAPQLFSDRRAMRSALYAAWQEAERKRLYDYDDRTCDDSCKVVEFFYLATAAYLGSAIDVAHDELRVKTRTDLKQKLPQVTAVIETKDYAYPRQMWPDGRYPHAKNITFSN